MTITATVSQVDYAAGMVKVSMPDCGYEESDWIPVSSVFYHMPPEGSQVMVSFGDEGYSDGFCHGNYFHSQNPPVQSGKAISYFTMAGDMVFQYDNVSKTLEISAAKIKINGDVEITGSLNVSGDLTAANFP